MRKQYSVLLAIGLVILAACSGTTPVSSTPEPAATSAPETPATSTPELIVVSDPLKNGDLAPDFTLTDSQGNMVNLANELQENEQVVLVFYYQFLCGRCMAQLRNIETDRAIYEESGVSVIAIAVQALTGAEATVRASQVQFPILADSQHVVSASYGVYDLLPEDGGLSTPSVFIINQDLRVVWNHVASPFYEEGEELLPTFRSGGCGGEKRVSSATIIENLVDTN